MLSKSEENYIKEIFVLENKLKTEVNTNCIADKLSTKASSVTDMLQKLTKKDLLVYRRYRGVRLTAKGVSLALSVIRKHRLWESFLVDTLKFNWDEVHSIAEQLEHINSDILINKLDSFLNYPEFNPHGDPIPDVNGKCKYIEKLCLNEMKEGQSGVFVGLGDDSDSFLKYLRKNNIVLLSTIKVNYIEDFDKSLEIEINNTKLIISESVASNIYLKK